MKNLFFILLLLSAQVYGQKDSAVYLREVSVSAERSKYESGLREEKIDSIEISRMSFHSLDQLVENNSAISLKQYGNGQLSTVSLRGGSSYHTSVLWNGFQLNSPLHGNADLTLYDNLFFDETTILYGGASTLWGSGAVSGSINLDNAPAFNRGLRVGLGAEFGSYSDFTQTATVSFGNVKYSGSVKFLNNDNKNDFQFYDENKELKNQINSSIKHYSFFTEHYFRTGNFSTLNFKGWYSYYDRDIPPALQQINSTAYQIDKNIRVSGEWKLVKEKYQVNIRSAVFGEKETYDDIYLNPHSQNDCNSIITEGIFEKKFQDKHEFQIGTNYTKFLVDSSANLSEVDLDRVAFFILYRYRFHRKFEFSLASRKELSENKDSPFLYSIGGQYRLLGILKLRSSFSKVFRFPTINDLYWQPGGNKDLKPESGYNAEAGFTLGSGQPRLRMARPVTTWFDFTFYYRRMNEWIIWYPSASYIWRPQNLQEVFSRGIETGLHFSYKQRYVQVISAFNYNYTVSTNEKSLHNNDESYQKQLIYVPLHSANFNLTFIRKNFSITTTGSYTGYQYITSDNTEFLPGYFTLNAEVSQKFEMKNVEMKIFVRIANLTNTDYQSMNNRPMPLRTFNSGINFTYRKPNKTQ